MIYLKQHEYNIIHHIDMYLQIVSNELLPCCKPLGQSRYGTMVAVRKIVPNWALGLYELLISDLGDGRINPVMPPASNYHFEYHTVRDHTLAITCNTPAVKRTRYRR